jgi:hypothetical protein
VIKIAWENWDREPVPDDGYAQLIIKANVSMRELSVWWVAAGGESSADVPPLLD